MIEKVNRRERKKSKAKERIINSGLKLFYGKGFNETTVAEIMGEADLGIGTFYNYFQSKEDLVIYCIGEKVAGAVKAIEIIKKKPGPASRRLSEMVLAAGQVFADNKPLLGLFMQIRRTNPGAKELPSHNNVFKEMMIDVFKQGQDHGEFRKDIPAGAVAEMAFGILQSLVISKNTESSFIDNLKIKMDIFFVGIMNKEVQKSGKG